MKNTSLNIHAAKNGYVVTIDTHYVSDGPAHAPVAPSVTPLNYAPFSHLYVFEDQHSLIAFVEEWSSSQNKKEGPTNGEQ